MALQLLDRAERLVRDGCFSLRRVAYTAPNLGDLNGARVEVRFHRRHHQRVYVLLAGRVHAVAEPREAHGYGDPAGRRDRRARQGELRAALRSLAESEQALRADEVRRRLDQLDEPAEVLPLLLPPPMREVDPPPPTPLLLEALFQPPRDAPPGRSTGIDRFLQADGAAP